MLTATVAGFTVSFNSDMITGDNNHFDSTASRNAQIFVSQEIGGIIFSSSLSELESTSVLRCEAGGLTVSGSDIGEICAFVGEHISIPYSVIRREAINEANAILNNGSLPSYSAIEKALSDILAQPAQGESREKAFKAAAKLLKS